ncbi:hypothetical protein [Fluviicola taffensis]|uniref:hypothetical protein n=1 Tax=Fluviicola taffensis TaxID=191579 RepID=UPI003137ABEF
MNILQKLARKVIKKSFNLSVWTIQQFYDMSEYNEKMIRLRKLPEGTLGYDIAKCLDQNQLTLVPKYESHDMKHVLLGYEMTPLDEIRMQAFMLGNGNYSFPCFAILAFGIILLPDKWTSFYKDFKKGRTSEKIKTWTIEAYADLNTTELKELIVKNESCQKKAELSLKVIVKYGAISAVTAGIFGMLFCLPFLFSSNIADLIGAGFPFVGGAVLTVGGLLTLSNISKHQFIHQNTAKN